MNTYNKTEEFLLGVGLPQQTHTYKVVPHRIFVDTLSTRLQNEGMNIITRRYMSTKQGEVMNGEFVVASDKDPELYQMFAFGNSYNKSARAYFSGGAYQKVCSNGLYLGNVRFFKKHRGNVLEELTNNIDLAIESAHDQIENIIYTKNLLKSINLTERQKSEILGRMLIEKNIITSTQMSTVIGELKKPTFDYGCPSTAFELYSFLTHSLKDAHPKNYMKQQIEVSNFFTEHFNIDVSNRVQAIEFEVMIDNNF